MGNLPHWDYDSSSPAGLCNTHTNYNWNDGAHRTWFWHIIILFLFSKVLVVAPSAGHTNSTLLTCIWSFVAGRSGYGGTENPSADMSLPLESHSSCHGNLCPSPGNRMLLHWHLCPRWSRILAEEKEKKNRKTNTECKNDSVRILQKREDRCKNYSQGGRRESWREIIIPRRMCHV